MPDTILSLAGIVFQDFEVPESINFGGQQRLAVHKLIGGARVVDAMGSDQSDISWSGRFRTNTALPRAQQIDALRIAGQPVYLSVGGISYQVVVSSFEWNYQRSYEIPYRITCTPSRAEVAPAQPVSSIDTLVGNDLSGATSLISSVQSTVASLTAPLAAVSSALGASTAGIGALSQLSGATGSQTASILSSITKAQVGIQGAISIGDGSIYQGAQQIGSVIPGAPAESVGNLSS